MPNRAALGKRCHHLGGEGDVLCQSVGLSRASGKRYSDVLLGDGAKARIDFLEGVTTQRSFAALGRALEEKIGVLPHHRHE
jgi:hypothetical protein